MIKLKHILESSSEITQGKTIRFVVNMPDRSDESRRMEDGFYKFFQTADKQKFLQLFLKGQIRRFRADYSQSEEGLDGGYWNDPYDIDARGRNFIRQMLDSDVVHMLNVYMRNIDIDDMDTKWKSSKRQSRIYKYLARKHFLKDLKTFDAFNDIMLGMTAILLGRYKDFIRPANIIEVSSIPTH